MKATRRPRLITPRSFLPFGGRVFRSHQPSGFTLLEVLFAIGLSFVLMSAVLSAIQLLGRISTTSQTAVITSQLARAVLTQIERDLLSCSQPPAAEESEEALSDETGTTDEVAVSTDVAALTGLFGITGTAESIVIQADRPSSLTTMATLQSVDSPSLSSQRSVSYFLSGQNGSPLAALSSGSGPSNAVGLVRLDGERGIVRAADERGDTETLASLSTLLAAEVATPQFRYFDWIFWHQTWDSGQIGSLPIAVEITPGSLRSKLDSQTSPAQTASPTEMNSNAAVNSVAEANSPTAGITTYRHVVRIPTAVYVPPSTSTF